jgi:N6-adenosine-specific RNA methylase IME4
MSVGKRPPLEMTRANPAGGIDGKYFEYRPILLDGFTLKARAAVPVGKPTLEQWKAAFAFASATEIASPYWVGDLLAYADTRQDWQERLDQAKAVTGLQHKTMLNRTYISNNVAEPERVLAPSISHSAEVAMLPQHEQRRFLTAARDNDWTRQELRDMVRASKRSKVIEGQAILEGQYRVIYADPPWKYNDSGAPPIAGSLGKAERHFPGMTIDEITALPVQAHAAENAVLLMWVTVPFLLLNPGPREVLEAWGFTYKSNRTWNKVLGNPGHYGMQVIHEHLLVCTRGRCLPDVPLPHDDSCFTERRSDVHSEKPESCRQFIERHWTSGPYLELFGRKKVEGWHVFGNDARLWAEEAISA